MLKNLDAIPSLAPISIIFILPLKFNNLTPSKSSSNIFVNLINDLDIKYKSGWLLIIFSKKYSIPDCVFEWYSWLGFLYIYDLLTWFNLRFLVVPGGIEPPLDDWKPSVLTVRRWDLLKYLCIYYIFNTLSMIKKLNFIEWLQCD